MNVYGQKYQIYEGDKLKVYRLKNYEHGNIAVLYNNKECIKVNNDDLKNKYIRLMPDAFMNIMITDHDENPDVYACVNKSNEYYNGNHEPNLIVRQSMYSIFTIQSNNNIKMGECISKGIESGKLSQYMEFDKIESTFSIALYIDDNVDTIINTIDDNYIKKINNELKYIKNKYSNYNNELFKIEGYVDNFKDLLISTDFISHYRAIFGIIQIDFPIVIDERSYDKNGDIILNKKQISLIEDNLRKHITNIKVIKYDKDIDIQNIVSLSHIVVSDINDEIYLIAYEVISSYPVDEDILRALNPNK